MVSLQHGLSLFMNYVTFGYPNHGLIFFQLPFTAVLLGLKFVSLGNSTRRVTFSLFSTHLVDESTLETKKIKKKKKLFFGKPTNQ